MPGKIKIYWFFSLIFSLFFLEGKTSNAIGSLDLSQHDWVWDAFILAHVFFFDFLFEPKNNWREENKIWCTQFMKKIQKIFSVPIIQWNWNNIVCFTEKKKKTIHWTINLWLWWLWWQCNFFFLTFDNDVFVFFLLIRKYKYV